MGFWSKLFGKKKPLTAGVVADYYEAWNQRYIESFGDIFQSYATADPEELIRYIIQSAGIADGARVLDAGCGIGGPALRIAKQLPATAITGLTISPSQVKMAAGKAKAENLSNRVQFVEGDFHLMATTLSGEAFDFILFLESLVHSPQPEVVINEAAKLCKPGSVVYIKDLFRHYDATIQQDIDYAVAKIEDIIKLNVQDVKVICDYLEKAGFTIAFCRIPQVAPDFNNGNNFMARNNMVIFRNQKGVYTGNEMMYLMYYEIKAVKK